MAAAQWFTGFECGDKREWTLTNANFVAVDDRRRAMTGNWYCKLIRTAVLGSVSHQYRNLGNFGSTLAVGETVTGRMQVRVRPMLPLTDGSTIASVCSFDDSGAGINARLVIDTNNFLQAQFQGTLAGGPLIQLSLGQTYLIKWKAWVTRTAGTATSRQQIRVYDAIGTQLLLDRLVVWDSFTPVSYRFGYPGLGSNQGMTGNSEIDFDDFWVSVGDAADADLYDFPPRSRVFPLLPAAQVAGTGWTGDWRNVRDLPLETTSATTEQTTSTNGAISDFQHAPVASLGIGANPPTVITIQTASMAYKYQYRADLPPPTNFNVYARPGPSTIRGLRGLFASSVIQIDNVRFEGPITPVLGVDGGVSPGNRWALAVARKPTLPSNFDAYPLRYFRLYYFNCGNDAGGYFHPQFNFQGLRSLVGDTTAVVARFKEAAWDSASVWQGYPADAAGPPTHEGWFFGDSDGVDYLTSTSTTTTTTVPGDPVIANAVKVGVHLKQTTGSSTQKLRIGTTEFDIAVTTAYQTAGHTQQAIDWNGRDMPQVDALTYGVRSTDTAAKQLGMIWGEMLCDGLPPIAQVPVRTYRHKIGTYSGTGTFQSLVIGFKPDLLIIKKNTGGVANNGGAVAAWFQSCGHRIGVGGAQVVDGAALQGFNDTGVELGPSTTVNGSGATYTYLALADGGDQTDGPIAAIDVFSRALGVSGVVTSRTVTLQVPITQSPFIPDVGLSLGGSTSNDYLRAGTVTNGSVRFGVTPSPQADAFQAFGERQITYGPLLVDTDISTILALRSDSWHRGHFRYGTFTGTGSPVTVTGLPFTPAFVAVTTVLSDGRWRSAAHTSTNSTPWNSGTQSTTGITALTADGFTVSNSLVGNGVQAWWFAFDADSTAPVTPTDDDPPVDPTPPGEGPLCAGGGMGMPAPTRAGTTGCTNC